MSTAIWEASLEAAARFFEPVKHAGPATPGDLARIIDPRTVQTPALDLIDAALERLPDEPDGRLIITMPPQEGKSTRVARDFPVWALTRNPDLRIISGSYAQGLANRNGRAVRNAIAAHPNSASPSPTTTAPPPNGPSPAVTAASCPSVAAPASQAAPQTSSSSTIPSKTAQRPTHPPSATPAGTGGPTPWQHASRQAPPSSSSPPAGTKTTWSGASSSLTPTPDGGSSTFPPSEKTLTPTRSDASWTSTWTRPAAAPPAQWEARKRTAGSRTWAALYQGHPSPQAGNVFHREWWRHWHHPPTRLEHVIQSWDMAFKGTATSDFVVGQVWAKIGADFYLLDQVRGRWNAPEIIAQVRLLSQRWPMAIAKLVEDKANGPAVIDMLRKEIPGLIAVEPRGGKIVRAEAVSPLPEAGNVYLPPLTVPWVTDLITEAASFPNATHDDQVDALTQALAYLAITPEGPAAQGRGLGRSV